MKTVNFYTLGCKVNMYETEAMKKLFIASGYTVTDKDDADVFVINTCTVTAMSDRKSRQMIRRAKHKNPNAIVVVAGCFSQVSQKQTEEMPEADIIVGTYGRKDIVKYVENYKGKKMNCVYDDIPAVFEEMPSESQSRTRAVIKIQDGCRNFCSYCIIPYARGPLRSRGIDEIIKEVTMLTKKGYKEFVFVGINLACYNYDGLKLGDVIEKVCEIDGVKRVRLGSLEPNVFTEKFLNTVKNQPKL
ncbi:MAG: radical SAM protein, partial [Clostridia bacterium]|nr:radical SAM protein [Clostridia bacterium]